MKKIILLSCVSKKADQKSKAKDLYQSTLFKKSLEYAYALKPDAIYILSAKYHLLELDTIIEPYDLTLNKMRKNGKMGWGKIVIEQLKKVSNIEKDKFVILAGNNYLVPIACYLSNVENPLKGMRIGERLKFLSENIKRACSYGFYSI